MIVVRAAGAFVLACLGLSAVAVESPPATSTEDGSDSTATVMEEISPTDVTLSVIAPESGILYVRYGSPGVLVPPGSLGGAGESLISPKSPDQFPADVPAPTARLAQPSGNVGLLEALRAYEPSLRADRSSRSRNDSETAPLVIIVPPRSENSEQEPTGTSLVLAPVDSAGPPGNAELVGQPLLPVADPTTTPSPVVPAPDTTATRPEQVREAILKYGVVRMRDVLFDTASADLAPRAFPLLDEVAAVLQSYPAMELSIEGHADRRGAEAYNQSLSEARALSVRNYLTASRGVEPARLAAQGFGESQPLDQRQTLEAYAVNRRVEFRVLNPEAATEPR